MGVESGARGEGDEEPWLGAAAGHIGCQRIGVTDHFCSRKFRPREMHILSVIHVARQS